MSRFNPQDEIAAGPHRFCDKIKFGAHRFHGVTDATLPHDEGWQFLRIGWSLERAEMTARLVDVQYQNLLDELPAAGAADNHQWMAVLRSVGAYEAYHRQYHSSIEPEKVAGNADPASAASALDPLQHHRSAGGLARRQRHRAAAPTPMKPNGWPGKLVERLSYDRVEEIFKQGLHSYLNELLGTVRLDRRRHRPNLLLLRGGGMNRYHLVHTTEFLYDGPVSESYNEVRLRPIHDEKQSCLSFRLTTVPSSRGTSYRDAYGNWVHQFNVLPEHHRLKVEAESVVLAHDAAEQYGGSRRRWRNSIRNSDQSGRGIFRLSWRPPATSRI